QACSLTLASREILQRSVREGGHVGELECLVNRLTISCPFALPGSKVRVSTHCHALTHAHAERTAFLLWKHSDQARHLRSRPICHSPASEQCTAGLRSKGAEQETHQRALSGAVRAQQRGASSSRDIHCHIIHSGSCGTRPAKHESTGAPACSVRHVP